MNDTLSLAPELPHSPYGTCPERWQRLYEQVPLCDVPRHFGGIAQAPFLRDYLKEVLLHCPDGGRTLETGIGSGYGAIWLSLRGITAEGIDYAPVLVERANRINDLLGGNARFFVGDLFHLYASRQAEQPSRAGTSSKPFAVIHHQGVLEHFTAPQIQAALAQQVALAEWVVFSVPSVYYPFDPEFGDERLLPLAEWEHLLAPFDVETLRYYGDPQLGGQEHVLVVLRGTTTVTEHLRGLMEPGANPYLPGVSAIIHTRNEARHIADALHSLQAWADEVIVCDMESTDATVAIARQLGATVISHPHIANFDRARNVSALRARHRWVFFLDADERVPPELGTTLRRLIDSSSAEEFEALLLPFRHHFAGQALRCLYPGYTAPRLLRNGCFVWGARPHTGAEVTGRTALFPAEDPALSLLHYSFDGLSHYLQKMDRYTDSESTNLHRDGQSFHWTRAVGHFAEDLHSYTVQGALEKDGVHGMLYAFLSGVYRFTQWGKLYERRYQNGQLLPQEREVPSSAEAILEYALTIVRQKRIGQETPSPGVQPAIALRVQNTQDTQDIAVDESPEVATVVWSGPLEDPSGYGEESRNFLQALEESGVNVAAHPLFWSWDTVDRTEEEQACYQRLLEREAHPGFVHILQNFPPAFFRHPQAGITVGRTMFETDRLPENWVRACNQMDRLWVPSAFNHATFLGAGVEEGKLRVIPGCFDPGAYQTLAVQRAAGLFPRLAGGMTGSTPFTFLSVFDWTRHKGWDVLLLAFVDAFRDRPDVSLILKVWSTLCYGAEGIVRQASALVEKERGLNLAEFPQIQFLSDRMSRPELLRLYAGADAFVLPSRGEGWGRPYMEAMALGVPVIGTGWSGNTAFMNEENSYLVRHSVVPVPEAGWQEVPTYRGHQWAEPDRGHLTEMLTRVVAEQHGEAAIRAQRGREEVTERFSRLVVGRLLAEEVAELRETLRPHPVLVSRPAETAPEGLSVPSVSALLPTPHTSLSRPVRVRWEGTQFRWHSLAHVNREVCQRLLLENTEVTAVPEEAKTVASQMELSLIPVEPDDFRPDAESGVNTSLLGRVFAPLSGPADVHVRHFFPPRLDRPREGRFVLIQPWEYGYLPQEWVEPIRRNVDEVWCYSQSVREVYRASGIPEEKLCVVPLGVDVTAFTPAAPPYIFTMEPGTERAQALNDPFTFLFVGGTLHRKGIDLLLEAYLRAFSPLDEVRLVIKDTGTQTVYQGQNARDRCLALASDTSRPSVLYVEEDLSSHRLAGLYTAADCLVQPYRGEGFCLPALEAMACGRPVVVPEGGPTDDFVDEAVGWRVPAERRPFGEGRIGQYDCVGPTWMLEVDVDRLARLLRHIAGNRPEAKQRGAAASRRVRAGWTWEHTTLQVKERLLALATMPETNRSLESQRPQKSCKTVKKKGRHHGVSLDHEARLRQTPTLSLCMIVRNEERVLGDCLASAHPWFDEIVVVDTGSTDRTVEIATQHGAKVFSFPWCDDFSAARNVSLAHATGDWVMWLDADDTLPEECGRQLRDLALLAEERTTGFLMQVQIPPAPGEVGFTVVDHVKMFRNQPNLRFEGRIHEQILEAISRTGGRVERSPLHVVHSGYDYSPEGQRKKRERDLTILEKDLAERPNHPFVWFNIGMTAFHLKDFGRAIPALEKCLSLTGPRESIVRKVYAMLVGCWSGKKELEEARVWLEKGLALFPRDPELLFRAGILYRDRGDWAAAERSYLLLLTEREQGHIDSWDVTMAGFKAHHNLALIYQERGRNAEAEHHFRAAIALQPDFAPSRQGLDLLLGKATTL